jgi:hypothetical protein
LEVQISRNFLEITRNSEQIIQRLQRSVPTLADAFREITTDS